MPRTEKSPGKYRPWTKRKPAPEPRPNFSHVNFEAMEAAALADAYGPRCAALISDTVELQRAPLGGVPFSCLTNITFAAPLTFTKRAA